VPPELFDEMEATWAPPSNPIFKLVPDAFDQQASAIYAEIGSPAISIKSFWIVYSGMLSAFTAEIQNGLSDEIRHADDDFEEDAAALPNQANLPEANISDLGYAYLGGLSRPPVGDESDVGDGPDDQREYAEFTDDEPDLE
jgi:hypothetical protein